MNCVREFMAIATVVIYVLVLAALCVFVGKLLAEDFITQKIEKEILIPEEGTEILDKINWDTDGALRRRIEDEVKQDLIEEIQIAGISISDNYVILSINGESYIYEYVGDVTG